MIARFLHRYLTPAESLLEILFGLIMALTMTVGARVVWHEQAMDVRELVLALLGCNLAWGIIDAMFYLLGARYGRNQTAHLIEHLRQAGTDTQALALIEQAIQVWARALREALDELRERSSDGAQ